MLDLRLRGLGLYSKTCEKRSLKIDKIKILMTNGSLMKVKVLQNAYLPMAGNPGLHYPGKYMLIFDFNV